MRHTLLAVLGVTLVLAATLVSAPAGAEVLYNDGHRLVIGTLVQGEHDDTQENLPPSMGCSDALRPAEVTVAYHPLAPTDIVTAVVHFVEGDVPVVLTSLSPEETVQGTAPDGCITPVDLHGTLVSGIVAYSVTDEENGAS